MVDPHIKIKLNGADSEGTVIALVKGYLTSWTEAELSQLPEGCAPADIANGEDINFWSLKLARASLDFRGSPPAFALLQELRTVFGDASVRLAKIGHWRKRGV